MTRVKIQHENLTREGKNTLKSMSDKVLTMITSIGTGSKDKPINNRSVTPDFYFSTDKNQEGELVIHFDSDDHADSAKHLVTALNRTFNSTTPKTTVIDPGTVGGMPVSITLTKDQTNAFLAARTTIPQQPTAPTAQRLEDLSQTEVSGKPLMGHFQVKAQEQQKKSNEAQQEAALQVLRGMIPNYGEQTNVKMEGNVFSVQNLGKSGTQWQVEDKTYQKLQVLQQEGYLKNLEKTADNKQVSFELGDRKLERNRIDDLPKTIKTLSATTPYADYDGPITLGVRGAVEFLGGAATAVMGGFVMAGSSVGIPFTGGSSVAGIPAGATLATMGVAAALKGVYDIGNAVTGYNLHEEQAYKGKTEYKKAFDGKNIDDLEVLAGITKGATAKEKADIGSPRVVFDETQTQLKFQFNEKDSAQAVALAALLNKTTFPKVEPLNYDGPPEATTLILDGKQTQSLIQQYTLTSLGEHFTTKQDELLYQLSDNKSTIGTEITKKDDNQTFTVTSSKMWGQRLTTTFKRLEVLQEQGYITELQGEYKSKSDVTFKLGAEPLTQQAIDDVTELVSWSAISRSGHSSHQQQSRLDDITQKTTESAAKLKAAQEQLKEKEEGLAELATETTKKGQAFEQKAPRTPAAQEAT